MRNRDTRGMRSYSRRGSSRPIVRVIRQTPFKTADEAIEFLEQTKRFLLLHKSVQNSTLSYDVYVFQNATAMAYRSVSIVVKLMLNGKEVVLKKELTDEDPDFNKVIHHYILQRAFLDRDQLGRIITTMFANFLTETLLKDRNVTDAFFKSLNS